MKFLAMSLLSLVSLSAFAAEKCEIRLSTKQERWFPTQYEAQKYCKAYEQMGCKIINPNVGRWNAIIDFNEVFKGIDDDFKTARIAAYKDYFQSLEAKAIYKTPFTFLVKFDCKSQY